jgi:hypothetical protein
VGIPAFFLLYFSLISSQKKPGGGFALPGLQIGAVIAGWRCAYPAYNWGRYCRVTLRLPGLQLVPLLPGGAALTRTTIGTVIAG